MNTRKLAERWVIVSGFAIALLAGGLVGGFVSSSVVNGSAESVPATTADVSTSDLTFAPAVKAALPAVVNISTAKLVRTDPGLSPMFEDPFFRRFFGPDFWERDRGPSERRERSLGSGVLVHEDGYVLTNNHVVEGAEEIQVSLSDGRELDAEIIGTDPRTDLALLRVHADGLPTITMGSSAEVEVGDIALAIGNPFGVGQTVTMGIVGAVARGNLGIVDYEDFIQTDASINPGNSGGALVDTRGSLIGINTAIIARGAQGNQGVGFAIPVDMAREVMDQLLDKGRVVRGWLGVSIQEVTPELARAFELDERGGALVSEVVPESPAARAGLEPGDVIVEVGGEPVEDVRALRLLVAATPPETELDLTVLRDGSTKSLSVTLDELPEEIQAPRTVRAEEGFLRDVRVRDLDPGTRRDLGLPAETDGALVTSVAPDGPAADSGLRRGDVIVSLNRQPVRSAESLRRLAAEATGDSVLIRVNRRGASLFLAVQRH